MAPVASTQSVPVDQMGLFSVMSNMCAPAPTVAAAGRLAVEVVGTLGRTKAPFGVVIWSRMRPCALICAAASTPKCSYRMRSLAVILRASGGMLAGSVTSTHSRNGVKYTVSLIAQLQILVYPSDWSGRQCHLDYLSTLSGFFHTHVIQLLHL